MRCLKEKRENTISLRGFKDSARDKKKKERGGGKERGEKKEREADYNAPRGEFWPGELQITLACVSRLWGKRKKKKKKREGPGGRTRRTPVCARVHSCRCLLRFLPAMAKVIEGVAR